MRTLEEIKNSLYEIEAELREHYSETDDERLLDIADTIGIIAEEQLFPIIN